MRRTSAALLALALAAAVSCRGEPGRPFDCTCTYLTDFDDGATEAVRACAPASDRAESVARGCAQASAPGPVQACVCRAVKGEGEGGAACATGCLPRLQ